MGRFTIGDYPPEYKPEVHGPYDPARYYGKPDTPFGQVKLGELGAWFGRRNKSPWAMWAAFRRAHWRWQHKYTLVRKPSGVHILQSLAAVMVIFYFANIGKKWAHRHAKYH